MDSRFDIEPQGGHEYLIRAFDGEQVVESRFTIDSDVLRELGLNDSDEQDVVEQAARRLSFADDASDRTKWGRGAGNRGMFVSLAPSVGRAMVRA